MAIIKSVTYRGQNKTDTLSSKVRIEDGNNRLVVSDNNGVDVIILNKDGLALKSTSGTDLITLTDNGLTLSDGTVNRLIIGLLPDGTIGMVVSKAGIDVYTAFS